VDRLASDLPARGKAEKQDRRCDVFRLRSTMEKIFSSGPLEAMRWSASSPPNTCVIPVFVIPGATALTLMSWRPSSAAAQRVNWTSAAFEVA
jgi:hypothetical protein